MISREMFPGVPSQQPYTNSITVHVMPNIQEIEN